MIDATFPPEIFDAILDHVHILDREAKSNYYSSMQKFSTKPLKTLLSCSLVCRSWLPRTRLHIFNDLHLPYYDRTIDIAFELVAHPLCTFRSHVRRLNLQESYNRNPTEALWLHSVLPQLALLTNVEHVYIAQARFTNVAEEEWRAGVQLFGPQLKRLDMHSVQFDRVSRITELVSRCTNLEHLALRYISLDEDLDSSPTKGGDIIVGTPPSRFLRSLALQHGIPLSAEFLTWLCPSPGSMKIPTVELEGISVEDAHHVSRFLYDIGPSITSLTIGFDPSSGSTDGQDAFCRVADLTTLSNLETLQFVLLAISPRGRELSAKHIPPILAKLDSPSLKEIQFHVSMIEAADFEMIDWASVVPTLNSARYSTLEVLLFRPIKKYALKETKAWLDEHVKSKLRRNIEIRCTTTY